MKRGLKYLALLLLPAPVFAHPGGLDRSGCHHDRKNGGYHCHGGSSTPAPRVMPSPAPAASAPVSSFAPSASLPNSLPQLNGYDLCKAIENLLKTVGYFGGVPDSMPDRDSLDAAARFRSDQRLPTSSITMDGALLVRLGEQVLAKSLNQAEAPITSIESRLATLTRLRQQGLIDEVEYRASRQKVLDSI